MFALLHRLGHNATGRLQFPLIRYSHGTCAPDRDSLEIFGPHDRAQPFTPRGPHLIDDAGHLAQVLSGGTDRGNPHVLIIQLVFDDLLGVRRLHAPDFLGTAELHLSVLDPDIGRFFSLPLNDQGVITRELQLHGKMPACQGHTYRACKR